MPILDGRRHYLLRKITIMTIRAQMTMSAIRTALMTEDVPSKKKLQPTRYGVVPRRVLIQALNTPHQSSQDSDVRMLAGMTIEVLQTVMTDVTHTKVQSLSQSHVYSALTEKKIYNESCIHY